MQTANVLLGLEGRRDHTVPKYGVTPAEIAVLRFLHGEDAVYEVDIRPETVMRTHRQEIERLRTAYSRRDGERQISPAVDALFPGIAAKVPQTFAELELPEELFVVVARRVNGGEPDSGKKGFEAMTLNDLRSFADTNNIDTHGLTRKADLVEAIELAMQAKAPKGDIFAEA